MSALFEVTEGWTGLLSPFTLNVVTAGVTTPLVLTGLTVAAILRDASGTLVAAGGVVTPLNQVTNPGQVSYAPVATDFVFTGTGHTRRQSYTLHWKVTDGAGKIVFFPNGAADEVSVYRA
jgi:hypothetical protein